MLQQTIASSHLAPDFAAADLARIQFAPSTLAHVIAFPNATHKNSQAIPSAARCGYCGCLETVLAGGMSSGKSSIGGSSEPLRL